MKREELAYQYENILNQTIGTHGSPQMLTVLTRILDEAIAVLEPWMNNIQRALSKYERKLYLERGIDISWNLRNSEDACVFNLCAQKDKKIPFAIKQAALITSLCTKVIECGVIEPNSHTIRSIINAYRLLDSADSTNSAKRAADARHSKADGSRDKQEKIRAVWASGKYDSRDICAEQECAALSMSFSTARKALRNTKDPT